VQRLAFAVGLLIAAAGIVMVAVPGFVLGLAQHPMVSAQLYASAVIRIGIGLLFWRVASVSRTPALLRVLGAMGLTVGVATLFVGVDRAQAIASWVCHQSLGTVRTFGLLPLALGAAIMYACAPVRRAA